MSLLPSSRTRWAAVILMAAALPLVSACAVVRQDQVGVRTTFGRVSPKPVGPGAQVLFPGVQGVITLPSRTVNREVRLELPSMEGLNVAAEVSILYRIKPDMAATILANAGEAYEDDIVLPVFRSAAADVSARYPAKDMHSGKRVLIEKAIREQMSDVLDSKGFIVENVLLKSIKLPADLAQAVEEKLEAEQRSEQMKFVLDRERQEAERRKIEAQGVRDAQLIVSDGLTPLLISYESIEAFRELARSPNAKVIITDGTTPYLIGDTVTATTEQRKSAAPSTGAPTGR